MINDNKSLAEEQEKAIKIIDGVHSEGEPVSATKDDNSGVFSEVMKKLGDAKDLYFGPYKVSELPYIVVDDGFHFYWNKQQLNDEGLFKVVGDKKNIVQAETGDPVAMDLSVTNLVVYQWIAIVLVLFAFIKVARKYKKEPTKAPRGFQNMMEIFVLFIRDEIVRPNIPSLKAANRLLPYFLGLFFFILVMNLLGLVPGGFSPTGSLAVTGALAITAFLVVNITAISVSGIKAWFHHLLGGAPWPLFFLMVPIEIAGMFIKPFALTIRLFANMTAGSAVILTFLGLLFYAQTLFIAPAVLGFLLFMLVLKTLVALLQAYIFTLLTAIFVGLAIGEHEHAEQH